MYKDIYKERAYEGWKDLKTHKKDTFGYLENVSQILGCPSIWSGAMLCMEFEERYQLETETIEDIRQELLGCFNFNLDVGLKEIDHYISRIIAATKRDISMGA